MKIHFKFQFRCFVQIKSVQLLGLCFSVVRRKSLVSPKYHRLVQFDHMDFGLYPAEFAGLQLCLYSEFVNVLFWLFVQKT